MYKRTTAVPILIPPAVDALAPPINIKISIPSQVLAYIAPVSIMLSPVDLGIEEVKMLAITFWIGSRVPRVPGLFHSEIAIPTAPTINRNKLAHKIIREFSDHCAGIE